MPSILPTPTIPLSYTEPPPTTLTVTITLSPSETPTPTPTSTPTPILSDLHIDHVERSGWDEEYVMIENRGTDSQIMTGWTIHNKTGKTYTFPTGFTLAGEARVRVWTRTGQDSNTNLFWASSTVIWSSESGTAYLWDDTHNLVDTFSW
jgi:competence protein ComEC